MTTSDSLSQGEPPGLANALNAMREYCQEDPGRLTRLRRKNSYFRSEVLRILKSLIPRASSILDVGCGSGEALAALEPRRGHGVDIDSSAWQHGLSNSPSLDFEEASAEEWDPAGQTFDYVIASGLLEHVYDIETVLSKLRDCCHQDSRVVIVTYSRLWQPLFRLAERLGLKTDYPIQNWIPVSELENLAKQSGLERITTRPAVLAPIHVPFVSRFLNRWIAPLPLLRHLDFVHVTVLRPASKARAVESVSIIIPARNEAGHVEPLLNRIPNLAPRQEVVFVEGNSTDSTWDEIQRVCAQRSKDFHSNLIAIQQTGVGKGDAVRAGFSISQGDVLLILDADISVPPEELPKFVRLLTSGAADFANGSRLVYSMESGAMRFLNLLGNRLFGSLFTYLLGQPVRDTLCGTKVLWRRDYENIAAGRERFGRLDPFGDFDLLFGATALNLRIMDVPVHYLARTYGETNISRFRHGLLLLRMSWLAARRIRFV